jgi:hypothetical protein
VETTGNLFDAKGGGNYSTVNSSQTLHDAYLMIAQPRHIPVKAFAKVIIGVRDEGGEGEAALAQSLQDPIGTPISYELYTKYWYHVDNVVFVTAEGQVGRAYHPDFENGIRAGDIVVGLFGINYPFILRKVPAEDAEEVVYTMVNVAYITGHEWGHDFIESAPDDAEWPNIEEYGLQRYTIV